MIIGKKNNSIILAVLFIVAFAIVAIVLLIAGVGKPKMKTVECISIIVIEEDMKANTLRMGERPIW